MASTSKLSPSRHIQYILLFHRASRLKRDYGACYVAAGLVRSSLPSDYKKHDSSFSGFSTNTSTVGLQDFTGQGQGNQSVWLLYSNIAFNKTFGFDCNDNTTALIAPFDQGTTVKNLLYPYDEVTLISSPQKLGEFPLP